MIKIQRIYSSNSTQPGYRILIDRLWPRGISKAKANLDDWDKMIAPSNKLRKWFNHDHKNFQNLVKHTAKNWLKIQRRLNLSLKLG